MRTSASAKGFTLIELLVAIVIVSILAAIAVPSYQSYIRRANRAIARAVLTDLAAKQDVLRVQTRSFATVLAPALINVTTTTPTLFYIDRSNKALADNSSATAIYKVTLSSPTADSYSLIAAGVGYQLKDSDCASLTLTSTGVRSALNSAGAANADCWGR